MLDLKKLEESFVNDLPLLEPSTAYFNIVRRCNAGCKYCLDWTNDPSPSTDLTIEKIEEILRSLKKLGVSEVVFSGGEPYLRKDIIKVLQLAKTFEFTARIITNGTAFTEKNMLATIESGVTKIGVSIDSVDNVRFETIRGLNLELVKRNIGQLVKLREQHHKNLDLSLYVTITKLNIDDLIPLANYAKDLDVKIQFQPVHFAGTGLEDYIKKNLWPNEIENQKLELIVQELLEMRKKEKHIGSRPEYLAQIPSFFRNKTFYPMDRCYVSFVDIVIDQDLGVRPCWSMDPVGYLHQNSLEELWTSEKMKEIRTLIRLKKCPGCLYSCHINKKHVPLPLI